MKCSCISHNGLLTERGYAKLAQQTSLEGLLPRGVSVMVDIESSVSGLRRDEDLYAHVSERQLLEQSERFLHGS